MEAARQNAQGLSIGIIMDGNGRWAQKRGLPRTAGHKKGMDVFDDITRYANDIGVRAITYYTLSTENWQRPADELKAIMDLFGQGLKRLYKHRKENNRVVFLGDRTQLAAPHRRMMDEIEGETAQRTGMILNIAVNYGGRQEMVRAARLLAQEVKDGILNAESIDEACIAGKLYTAGQPDPDFILRTSGEQRLSNFLLWQCAYSELVYTNVHWPDFTRANLDEAIAAFRARSRRFGGI